MVPRFRGSVACERGRESVRIYTYFLFFIVKPTPARVTSLDWLPGPARPGPAHQPVAEDQLQHHHAGAALRLRQRGRAGPAGHQQGQHDGQYSQGTKKYILEEEEKERVKGRTVQVFYLVPRLILTRYMCQQPGPRAAPFTGTQESTYFMYFFFVSVLPLSFLLKLLIGGKEKVLLPRRVFCRFGGYLRRSFLPTVIYRFLVTCARLDTRP